MYSLVMMAALSSGAGAPAGGLDGGYGAGYGAGGYGAAGYGAAYGPGSGGKHYKGSGYDYGPGFWWYGGGCYGYGSWCCAPGAPGGPPGWGGPSGPHGPGWAGAPAAGLPPGAAPPGAAPLPPGPNFFDTRKTLPDRKFLDGTRPTNLEPDRNLKGPRGPSLGAAPGRVAPGMILVKLPEDARLFINGAPTSSTSTTRLFTTPPLPPGQVFTCTLRAEYQRDGKTAVQTREVIVTGGVLSRVTLPDKPDVRVTGR